MIATLWRRFGAANRRGATAIAIPATRSHPGRPAGLRYAEVGNGGHWHAADLSQPFELTWRGSQIVDRIDVQPCPKRGEIDVAVRREASGPR